MSYLWNPLKKSSSSWTFYFLASYFLTCPQNMISPPSEFWSPFLISLLWHFGVTSVLSHGFMDYKVAKRELCFTHHRILTWQYPAENLAQNSTPMFTNCTHFQGWDADSIFHSSTSWYRLVHALSFIQDHNHSYWLEKQPQYCSFIVNKVGQWISKCAPHTSSISSTWEHTRKAKFQASSLSYSTRNSWGENQKLCLTCLRGDADVRSSLGTTGLG